MPTTHESDRRTPVEPACPPEETHTIAPYGCWKSAIGLDQVIGGQVELSELTVDGTDLYWLESQPDQDGRIGLLRWRDGNVSEITPRGTDVRSQINGYGGGCFDVRNGVSVWAGDRGTTITLRTPDGTLHPIVEPGPVRFGDLRVHPGRSTLLAIREDSTGPGEPVAQIVALPWPGAPETSVTILAEGADFYANPELNDDGRLAWVEWNHPNMPWDGTKLRVGHLSSDGRSLTGIQTIVDGDARNGEGVSVQHPAWTPDGQLLFMSDESGYWNLHIWDGTRVRPVHDHPYDFDEPAWVLGNHAFAQLDEQRVVVWFRDDAITYLATIDLTSGKLSRATSVAGVLAVAAVKAIDTADGYGHVIALRPDGEPIIARLSDDGTLEPLHKVGDDPTRAIFRWPARSTSPAMPGPCKPGISHPPIPSIRPRAAPNRRSSCARTAGQPASRPMPGTRWCNFGRRAGSPI